MSETKQPPKTDVEHVQWMDDCTLEVRFKEETFLGRQVTGNALLDACDNYERVLAQRDELEKALRQAEAYTSLNVITTPPQATSMEVLAAIRAALAKLKGGDQ